MEIIILLAIVILTAVFITLPFFRKNTEVENPIEQKSNPIENPALIELKKLTSEKELLYTALNDIEFDYGLGKLSREDYDELKREYQAKAVSVLKEIDEISKGLHSTELEDELEKEITAIRKSKSHDENEIEDEILKARKQHNDKNRYLTCINCGRQYSAGDLFCSRCGIGLKDVS
ncbi:MAG: zinc ribbon domain-containing protein [Thermodesulfobacteriota bacterium]